jgi:hypothetical protein
MPTDELSTEIARTRVTFAHSPTCASRARQVPSFLRATGLILGAIGVLVALDEINIYFHLAAPGDRIVSSQVIMTLLGATTAQVHSCPTWS